MENKTENTPINYNALLGTVFLLWAGDSYVEMTGTTEPDGLEGVFTSIDEMNKYLQDKYYELPLDTRGLKFDKDVRRHSVDGKYGNEKYVYYEETTLNCA